MRSRVLTLKDPRTVKLPEELTRFKPNQEELEQDLRRAVNRFIRWKKGEKAAGGDMVVCRLASDCPRFQKERVKFIVGSGMFHRELEALADGMTVGETRALDLPEGRVSLTVLEVTNRLVPELTDELVEKMGLEGVRTAADYTGYLVGQQKAEWDRMAPIHLTDYLTRQVIDGSEFVLYEEDWQALVDLRLNFFRACMKKEGLTLEEMTPEQIALRFPAGSYYELVSKVQRDEWTSLCLILMGRQLAAEAGAVPDEDGYVRELRSRIGAWAPDEEGVRALFSYEQYVKFFYSSLADEALSDAAKHALSA